MAAKNTHELHREEKMSSVASNVVLQNIGMECFAILPCSADSNEDRLSLGTLFSSPVDNSTLRSRGIHFCL